MALIGTKAGRRISPSKGLVVHRTHRGTLSATTWPRRRGKPKTQPLINMTMKFDWVERNMKRVNAREQVAVMEAVIGTQWLWRDVLTCVMYGTMWALVLPNGREVWPVQAQTKVSESLDVLGNDEGVILVRSDGLWIALQPGTEGQVLTAHGSGVMPTWEDPA